MVDSENVDGAVDLDSARLEEEFLEGVATFGQDCQDVLLVIEIIQTVVPSERSFYQMLIY